MTRVLLFDWTTGGHHARYARRFAETLVAAGADVVLAVPDAMAAALADLPVELHALGPARPPLDDGPAAPQHRRHALAELERLERAVARCRPHHVVHLYADPVLRRLVERPPLGVPLTLVVFFARAHYPWTYRSPLPPRELARAWFQELLLARWRRRPDAGGVLFLDPEAARRWRRRGMRAEWLPEPPVTAAAPAPADREGCVLFGALDRRKGVDRLARAVEAWADTGAVAPRVTLAGTVAPDFAPELEQACRRMADAGADVRARFGEHDEAAALRLLAGARCAVLPYPRHFGMSRVLLEAAAAGTPVVAHDFGLLGHLVRRHGLGLAVDCARPAALAQALAALVGDATAAARHASALASFTVRFAPAAFARALGDAITLPRAALADFSTVQEESIA